jgi:hypothetical protein
MLIFDFYIILCYNKYVKRERGIPLGILKLYKERNLYEVF